MRPELKPDFEESYDRYEAFWSCEVADRPPVCIKLPRESRETPGAEPAGRDDYSNAPDPNDHRARWLDLETRVERIERELENTAFLGDAMPIAWPNMGPEIFSAWCGAGYEFGETTAWSEPIIEDWERDAARAHLDMEDPLFKATLEFTNRLIERGRGRFIVGLTDFHPGGDHLAALRDPTRLATDLIDNPEPVKRLLAESYEDYWKAYELFYTKIRDAGMPTTSWLPLLSWGRYYIPSNDFSAMIGATMFEEFFLDGIVEECRYLDRSIYHLDGPDALRHLDLLLSIDELDAIQFVPGAGNENLERWIPVYQKIQSAKKGIQILSVTIGNMNLVFENLKPEGVFVGSIDGIEDRETAERVLQRFADWR